MKVLNVLKDKWEINLPKLLLGALISAVLGLAGYYVKSVFDDKQATKERITAHCDKTAHAIGELKSALENGATSGQEIRSKIDHLNGFVVAKGTENCSYYLALEETLKRIVESAKVNKKIADNDVETYKSQCMRAKTSNCSS